MQWFRAEPEARQKCDIELYMHLLEDVKSRIAKGAIKDCLTVQTINEMPKNGMTDLEVAYAVSSPFGAGIETVSSTFRTDFILSDSRGVPRLQGR
jgi:hypothetical protein